jgi:hypothetical protein
MPGCHNVCVTWCHKQKIIKRRSYSSCFFILWFSWQIIVFVILSCLLVRHLLSVYPYYVLANGIINNHLIEKSDIASLLDLSWNPNASEYKDSDSTFPIIFQIYIAAIISYYITFDNTCAKYYLIKTSIYAQ